MNTKGRTYTKPLYATEKDHKRVRIEAAECGREQAEVVAAALALWFARPKRERQNELKEAGGE